MSVLFTGQFYTLIHNNGCRAASVWMQVAMGCCQDRSTAPCGKISPAPGSASCRRHPVNSIVRPPSDLVCEIGAHPCGGLTSRSSGPAATGRAKLPEYFQLRMAKCLRPLSFDLRPHENTSRTALRPGTSDRCTLAGDVHRAERPCHLRVRERTTD
jgi:hypothetical protein